MTQSEPEQRLAERLYQAGAIGEDQLRIARTEQAASGDTLERALIRLGFVAESVLREHLGDVRGQASIDLAATVPDAAALACLPKNEARRLGVLPVSHEGQPPRLLVAMADPGDLVKLDRLRAQLDRAMTIEPVLAGEREIEGAIDRFYGYELTVDGILEELEAGPVADAGRSAQGREYGQPVVRLIDAVLADAVKQGASDVHFEPERGFVRIRYRIDGVLRQVRSLHAQHWPPMCVRLKVLADLDIAEARAPQDGRTTLTVGGHSIDFRVSVVSTIHGENVVLRILDREKGIRSLDALGLDARTCDGLAWMRARPEGLILVTGPTGSGKTTTLYSLLAELDHDAVNTVTLEDPVEYPVPRVRQSAVNEAAGLDFANGIRHLMRQDPDVMLVGEIRDEATATMAFRAAMTGHQVYSTLHTNSALAAVARLLDLGIRPDVLAGHTIGVMGQRLVRRLCDACKAPDTPSAFESRLMGVDASAGATLYRPVGCTACGQRGYRGRVAIAEVVAIDADFADLIARRAGRRELAQTARDKGLRSLAADGLRHVAQGDTALAEVARVVDLTNGA